jgi:signal transduction histidine kinase/HAMP domain-containing protein
MNDAGTQRAPTAEPAPIARRRGLGLSFRGRLTIALLLAVVLPLAAFGAVVLVIDTLTLGPIQDQLGPILLFAMLVVALLAIPLAFLAAAELLRPLRAMAGSVERVTSGDLSTPIEVPGDDELARLAASHNRLAADLQRRSVQIGRMLEAIGRLSPGESAGMLAARAGEDAAWVFELIGANVYLAAPDTIPEPEVVPGETRSLRAVLRAGEEELGLLLGWLPATRGWTQAEQDLFELFASQVAVALRDSELFLRVESQNAQLVELAESKDEFLRGVSHNLQSPLTSIRAYADQLRAEAPDRRLEIIVEQSERLYRIVRQLLTVSRLQYGAIKPRSEVVNLAHLARTAWEALGASEVPFELVDRSDGWLAIADADHLDQVLWALLDNAVKHGEGKPVSVRIAADPANSSLSLTIGDEGPGVPEADRSRLFGRFERGMAGAEGGSGLGLYVSRRLCQAMGGQLSLEESAFGQGAEFTVQLPAELAAEG